MSLTESWSTEFGLLLAIVCHDSCHQPPETWNFLDSLGFERKTAFIIRSNQKNNWDLYFTNY